MHRGLGEPALLLPSFGIVWPTKHDFSHLIREAASKRHHHSHIPASVVQILKVKFFFWYLY